MKMCGPNPENGFAVFRKLRGQGGSTPLRGGLEVRTVVLRLTFVPLRVSLVDNLCATGLSPSKKYNFMSFSL